MMVSLVSAKDRFSFSVATVLLFLFAWPSCAVHREDDSRYFLFIEPDATKKSIEPVDDDLTASLQSAWDQRVAGTSRYTDLNCPGYFTPSESGYRGFHFAEDGEISDTMDYLLPNGFITNSLCLHYVRFYRDQLPPSELRKLQLLHEYMERNSLDENQCATGESLPAGQKSREQEATRKQNSPPQLPFWQRLFRRERRSH